MDNTILASLLIFAVIGFVAWLGGGRRWAFRVLVSVFLLLGIGAAGVWVYSYWTSKSAEHQAQKIHQCAIAKVADPKCVEPPKGSSLPSDYLICPEYTLADDASRQQEDEAVTQAEQECRGEMNPTEKSLHEQIVQYKHDHGIKEALSDQPKQDVFDRVGVVGAKTKKLNAKACAAKVRTFYPHAYDDFDDATLTKKVLAKYPEYCDIVSRPDFIPDIQGIR